MLNNIKTKQSGFTIVELLIVIVVIAILAAITIVAYNGIQNRAKTSSGQQLANSVVKKAEAYNAAGTTGAYPAAVANFADVNESKLDNTSQVVDRATTGAGLITTQANYSDGQKVIYRAVNSNAGACVWYWDFTKTTAQNTLLTMGTATATNCTT